MATPASGCTVGDLKRGVALSVWGATAGVATLVGPLAGGGLVEAEHRDQTADALLLERVSSRRIALASNLNGGWSDSVPGYRQFAMTLGRERFVPFSGWDEREKKL